MLKRIALGVPRFSITSERRSSSIWRRSLPKFVRACKAETTMVAFFAALGIEGTPQFNKLNCTVDVETCQRPGRGAGVPPAILRRVKARVIDGENPARQNARCSLIFKGFVSR